MAAVHARRQAQQPSKVTGLAAAAEDRDLLRLRQRYQNHLSVLFLENRSFQVLSGSSDV